MLKDEKDRLLALLHSRNKWCRDAEARDHQGRPVHFDDPAAVAWDLTGAVCVLFGWARALELFPQLERQLVGGRRVGACLLNSRSPDPRIGSMVAIQEYNDKSETTHEELISRLKAMPVYQRGARPESTEKILI